MSSKRGPEQASDGRSASVPTFTNGTNTYNVPVVIEPSSSISNVAQKSEVCYYASTPIRKLTSLSESSNAISDPEGDTSNSAGTPCRLTRTPGFK
ncbi:hypothetical protein DICVIV_12028 [Dictyocaulus viviparus]|uniref:Uncharacterized protein n=1 Tax=Dictyocaulus viviparus TaxID=29172 RepID=A0A0D8XBN6_DICVI|nr:hypothetical protein DICVIV_12028 [Dictyocaulus viviparus]